MVVMESAVPGRRALAGRSPETVDRLLSAGLEVLREKGYDQLSMREVCRRAELTHATAYGYFSAKQHLIAEAYRRRIDEWCEQPITGETPLERLSSIYTGLAALMAAEPELSTAASAAVLSRDPDVERIRTRIGLAMVERLRIATGELCSDTMLEALSIAVSGAMVQAGMNYYTFEEMAARLTSMTELLLRGQ
ncbi:TetR/AcrR family transcriptional regulator [Nocardia cyriacigeorgica]|uniref:TetR/AcrR family transcriptional regulator n=1 Tax=Nocardia cyriacigeorgica TaxID=135487 RepID=UPI002455D81F|nr:TetR/AcrR family transcriptional regulator [Nocardia cyriacigeorgica]BDU05111.1 putative HTH-type transcriptional regulator [Nocardia cyriacigeorgica]